MMEGLRRLGGSHRDCVLWIQHENAIWPDNEKFVSMLEHLELPKIITFHTLHFESSETAFGLRQNQYDLLAMVLPHVDAITVFSHGVYQAVTTAFPQHRHRVFIIRHGVPFLYLITQLSRREAKQQLRDFLLAQSDLAEESKRELKRQQSIFLDPDTFIIGETGFLCPAKQSELLYTVRDSLQSLAPGRKIVAVRIGSPRDEVQRCYAKRLREMQNNTDKFLFEICLPEDMLSVALRAFDLNFYWPRECSQSGILARAVGVGALVAGRDLEGSGEMLRKAGALVHHRLDSLIEMVAQLVSNPEHACKMEETAFAYASVYSWGNQALRHRELAENVSRRSRDMKLHYAIKPTEWNHAPQEAKRTLIPTHR